jgi:uncharacterized protein YihD (DUF1040 family)
VKIASCVPGRTTAQCHKRWHQYLRPGLIKGPWKKEDDDKLKQLVEKCGNNKQWSKIAESLAGRTGLQCRQRWCDTLDPSIEKGTWTREEDEQIIQLHEKLGNKWADIAKELRGRTDQGIRNRWNRTLRRQVECGGEAIPRIQETSVETLMQVHKQEFPIKDMDATEVNRTVPINLSDSDETESAKGEERSASAQSSVLLEPMKIVEV